MLAVAAVDGLDKTSSAVHTGLLLVGRCGRLVHVCARPLSQRRLPQGLRSSASSAAHLSLVEWQIHSPVTSACMAHGLLIYCSAGQAYCAAMHERDEAITPQPSQHAAQHSGCANTEATLVPQLQPVQWLGSGLGVLLLALPLLWGSSCLTDGTASQCTLLALTLSGCLLHLPAPQYDHLARANLGAEKHRLAEKMEVRPMLLYFHCTSHLRGFLQQVT